MRKILSIAIALLLCACILFIGALAAPDPGTAVVSDENEPLRDPGPTVPPGTILVPTSEPVSPTTASASSADVEPTPAITPVPTSEAVSPTNVTVSPTDIEPTSAPIIAPTVAPVVEPTVAPIVRPTVAPVIEPTVPPITEPTEDPLGEATPKPKADIGILADGKSAVASGEYDGLYARVALILDNGGVSGLYVTQAMINTDGTILVPEFMVPGLTVKGVNIALVGTLDDIQSSTPNVVVSAFMMYK